MRFFVFNDDNKRTHTLSHSAAFCKMEKEKETFLYNKTCRFAYKNGVSHFSKEKNCCCGRDGGGKTF